MEKKFYKFGNTYVIELDHSHYYIDVKSNELTLLNSNFIDSFDIYEECSKEEINNALDLVYNNLKQLF
jgi:hypothetical protein